MVPQKNGSSEVQIQIWHWLTWLAAGLFCVVAAVLSLTRLYTGKASLFDLGVFDQAIWTTVAQRLPTTTIPPPYDITNWLGFHFSPIVLFLAPFYYFIGRPEFLIVVQSVLISSASILIFGTCRQMTGSPRESFCFSMLFLFNPFVLNAAVWDFHEKSFATALFALAYYALSRRDRMMFIFAMVGILLCQEHYGLAVAGFGVLWQRVNRNGNFGYITAAVSVICTVALIFVFIPLLNPHGAHAMLNVEAAPILARYTWLRPPFTALKANLAELVPGMLFYFILLLVPATPVALLAPLYLLPGCADLLANMLSGNPMPKSPFSYHSMVLAVVFVIATCRSVSERPRERSGFLRLAFVTTILMTYLCLPWQLPGSFNVWQMNSVSLKRDPAIAEIEASLDPKMSISAQANMGMFFSKRPLIYPFPAKIAEVDAVVLQVEYPYESFNYAPFSIPMRDAGEMVNEMEKFLNDDQFGLVYWKRNWLVGKRGARDLVNRAGVLAAFAQFKAHYYDEHRRAEHRS